jgi:hypothetical protein
MIMMILRFGLLSLFGTDHLEIYVLQLPLTYVDNVLICFFALCLALLKKKKKKKNMSRVPCCTLR